MDKLLYASAILNGILNRVVNITTEHVQSSISSENHRAQID